VPDASSLPSDPPRLFFLGDGETALPCIARGPALSPRATLVVVPPFAEEMNRCRLWLSQTTIRLAAGGVQTLLFDLPGTGDSPMPWQAATWDIWVQATRQAIAWGTSTGPTHVMGVRFGGLLAAVAIPEALVRPASLMLAAAQESGEMAVRGLLRAAGDPAALGQRLEAGETIMAAGYALHAGLTRPAAQQKLATLLAELEIPISSLDLTGLPSPWLQVEPEEPDALVDSTAMQLLARMGMS
jgi:pimeloyl-ACP methyl ester carboxylesterase